MFMAAKYITFREPDEEGNVGYYILQKDHPHFVGKIELSPKKNLVQPSPLAGYNMWVSFGGCLRGNVVPSYNKISETIVAVLDDMAIWYLDNRIKNNEKKYSKFKINATTATQ